MVSEKTRPVIHFHVIPTILVQCQQFLAQKNRHVSLAERLDHLETDFSERLGKLMKLQEAAMCKPIRQPEVSVWEAAVVSLVEPNGAACSNIDVKLQSSTSQPEALTDESKAAWPHNGMSSAGCNVKMCARQQQISFIKIFISVEWCKR